jgi:hypothetical protein
MKRIYNQCTFYSSQGKDADTSDDEDITCGTCGIRKRNYNESATSAGSGKGKFKGGKFDNSKGGMPHVGKGSGNSNDKGKAHGLSAAQHHDDDDSFDDEQDAALFNAPWHQPLPGNAFCATQPAPVPVMNPALCGPPAFAATAVIPRTPPFPPPGTPMPPASKAMPAVPCPM